MAKTESSLKLNKRRFNWPRIFGYDFFISFKLGHPPIGTQSYASDLARRLRELDFTVFFSEDELSPGSKLEAGLVKVLHRARILVVIANEGALVHSQWVRKEVEEFRGKHPKRQIISINVDRAIETFGSQVEASKWLDHEDRTWLNETNEAIHEGIVSPAVRTRHYSCGTLTRLLAGRSLGMQTVSLASLSAQTATLSSLVVTTIPYACGMRERARPSVSRLLPGVNLAFSVLPLALMASASSLAG